MEIIKVSILQEKDKSRGAGEHGKGREALP